MGNRHQFMAPHGCYPCKGKDEWVTLAVRDDADWQAFCRVLDQGGDSPAVHQDKFATAFDRLQHQDEVDEIVSSWTANQGQYQVMETLQAAGIPAGPVLNARSLLADPHFQSRGFFESVEHSPLSGLGRRAYIGRGWKLSGNDLTMSGPGPLLGEGNQYVLDELLGLLPEETDSLRRKGLIGDYPVDGRPPSVVPLDRQVELGWMVERDRDYRPR